MAEYIFINGEDIVTKDFSNLTDIQQQQLLITLIEDEKELQKALSSDWVSALKKAWRKAGVELCQFWQVADRDNLDTLYFDFWRWNVDTGCIFKANTTEYTHIAMIQYGFDPQIPDENEYLYNLSNDLNEAFNRKKLRKEVSICVLDENDEILDFKNPEQLPDNVKTWNGIFTENKVSADFIRKYQKYINKKGWELISQYSTLSDNFIEEFSQQINWKKISECQQLSEDFIRKFQHKVHWQWISFKQKLSEAFILELKDKVDWDYISSSQVLSEDFIREHQDKLSWAGISWAQKLSEDFLHEFHDKINWETRLSYQPLSEEYLRELAELNNWSIWNRIIQTQNISLQFIEDYLDKIEWRLLSMNPYLTQEVIDKYFDKIVWSNMTYFNSTATKKFFTEEVALKIKDLYDLQQWKMMLPYVHHFTKAFKAEFLQSLKS